MGVTRIAMVVFSYYPSDTRVRREAEALVEAGMSVDVICLRWHREPTKEIINGVCVYRLALKRKRGRRLSYILQYIAFIFLAFVKLSISHLAKHYDIIHVHNMPDILVFAALLPGLSGSKVLLDIHDPTPEVYMAKYSVRRTHPAIRLLTFLEKCSIRFSDLVITPNIAFRNVFISRSCPDRKVQIVMNSPPENIFHNDAVKVNESQRKNPDEFVMMYHGTIVERNGLDTALEAIACLQEEIPNLVFHVYGNDEYVDQILNLVNKLDLNNVVKFHGFLPWEMIPGEIQLIDLGVIPNKMNPFNNINLPVRIFEYLSLGKPVVAPRTQGIMDYFDEKSLFFFEAGNADSLSKAILEVYRNPIRCQEVTNRGISTYSKYRWESQRRHFVGLVKNLLENRKTE